MKKSLRVIVIGSIFLLCGASFFGIVSVNNDNISTGFWNVRQLVTTTYAEDDEREGNEREGNERGDNEENSSRRESNDNDNRKSDDNYRAPTTTTPSTSTNTSTPSTSTPSTVTPTQTCKTVYDTVTNASGTASQVARQSCTTTPTPSTNTTTPTPVVTPTTPTPTTSTSTQTPTTPTPTPVVVGSQFKDGTYTGIGKYSFPGGGVDYSVSLTIASGKISQASFVNFTVSGNGKYTRAQGDAALQKLIGGTNATIDTVTGATGTSQAIQDAVNNALSKAQTSGTTTTTSKTPAVDSSFLNDILNSDTTSSGATVIINTHKNIPTVNTVSSSTPTEHTAPNGKIYTISSLTTGAYIFERPDGTISSQKFTSYQSVIGFIDKNNQELQSEGTYTTPNGKIYTIINNATSDTYMFKRPDGSVSSREFTTKNALIAYIRQNNPIATPVRSITVRQLTPTSARTISVQRSTTPAIQTMKTPTATVKRNVAPVVTTAAKPTAPSASTTTATQAAAAAKAKTQAAASAKAATAAQAQASATAAAKAAAQQAAAKAAASAAAAKVNTTTAAS